MLLQACRELLLGIALAACNPASSNVAYTLVPDWYQDSDVLRLERQLADAKACAAARSYEASLRTVCKEALGMEEQPTVIIFNGTLSVYR